MTTKSSLTPTRDQLSQWYHVEQKTLSEIGAICHRRSTWVRDLMLALGMQVKVGKLDNAERVRDKVLEVWDAQHTTEEVMAHAGIGHGTLYRIVRKFNIPPKPRPDNSGESNGNWKGGYEEYYGPNWESQRKACLVRDGYLCRRCGTTKEEMDREPDVHHLRPFRTFQGNFELANTLTNLVALCCACHTFCERHPHIPLPAQPDPSLRSQITRKKGGYVQPTIVSPEEVARRYQAGEDIGVTCRLLGISTVTYFRSLKRAGVKAGRRGSPIDRERVLELFREGKTRKQIAEILACNLASIYRIVPVAA
jgi:transposase